MTNDSLVGHPIGPHPKLLFQREIRLCDPVLSLLEVVDVPGVDDHGRHGGDVGAGEEAVAGGLAQCGSIHVDVPLQQVQKGIRKIV